MLYSHENPFLLWAVLACGIPVATAAGAGNVTMKANGFAPSWVEDPDGRGTWTIVYSSALTLFFAAWAVVHLNIPPYRATRLQLFKRWLHWGFCSFIFPEMIILVAFSQLLLVRDFRKAALEIQRKAEANQQLKVDPSSGTNMNRNKANTLFSNIYAWYAVMGGLCMHVSPKIEKFVVSHDNDKCPVVINGHIILKPDGILELARHGHVLQVIEDEEIQDKSKADFLAKAMVCVQILWFVCQSIQRKIAHLPLSLLEFHVLVNIGCGLITYAIWFNKPRDVQTSTVIGKLLPVEEFATTVLSQTSFDFTLYAQENSQLRQSVHTSEVWDSLWACTQIKTSDQDDPDAVHVMTVIQGRERLIIYIHKPHGTVVVEEIADLEKRLAASFGASVEEYRAAEQWDISGDTSNEGNEVQSLSDDDESVKARFKSEMEEAGEATTVIIKLGSPLHQVGLTRPGGRCPELSETPHAGFAAGAVDQEPSVNQGRGFSMIRLPEGSVSTSGVNHDFAPGRGHQTKSMATLIVVLSGYGAIHLIPDLTTFTFPTDTERLIWRYSCYIIISCVAGVPILYHLFWWFYSYGEAEEKGGTDESVGTRIEDHPMSDEPEKDVERIGSAIDDTASEAAVRPEHRYRGLGNPGFWVFLAAFFLYLLLLMVVRSFLMVESFISLRKERIEIFQTPDWNWLDYIPHI